MVEASCSAQCLIFSQVFDADVREALGDVFDEVPEDRFLVVANDEDFFDLLNLGNSPETVLDYRMAGDFEERLFVVRRSIRWWGYSSYVLAYLGQIEG